MSPRQRRALARLLQKASHATKKYRAPRPWLKELRRGFEITNWQDCRMQKRRLVRKARPAPAACVPLIRSLRPERFIGGENKAAIRMTSQMMTKISCVGNLQFDAGKHLSNLPVALGVVGRYRRQSPPPNPSSQTIRPGCLLGHERDRCRLQRWGGRKQAGRRGLADSPLCR